MKKMLLIIIFLLFGVSQALAIPPHKITPEERAAFPWWNKARPVRPSAGDKKKTISHMRLAIKLEKMSEQND